ncbi:XRE family transcriptional regulator [Cryobacterium sp. Sr8]|uniref:helix-turn-helix domain-containing protein n=1 Tax=Cryobacterium sp. Sr8 TaxID=1259203 RepID=UPI00106BA947|nr:helix-turn-helix transcriptional regulator [Cryobacterium sp. Sr8]TFD80305.1 XRE family transcriptional regulator [Cryobacterium sp. Sr8]
MFSSTSIVPATTIDHASSRAILVRRVNAAREAAGLTVSALATATGMPVSTLRRQLLGQSDFKLSDIMRIGDHLGVSAGAAWFRDLPQRVPTTAGQAL